MSEIMQLVERMGQAGREAAARLVVASTGEKNRALEAVAVALEENRAEIQAENEKDLAAGRENGLTGAMLDRLALSDKRIDSMIDGVREVIGLPDPVGGTFDSRDRPNGLRICRMRVPIGVIGIIYESRPNVTVDAGALTLKSGNAVILRGGSEAINSNLVLARVMSAAVESAGLPAATVQLVPTVDRQAVGEMLRADKYIDLIIPRGGEALIRRVVENSTIPVIKHYNGICHVYVDGEADLEMAAEVAFNAKVQRPGVCNAMETLLVDSAVADRFLPGLAGRMEEAGVELRGCERTRALVPSAGSATEQDWRTEYLDMILSVRVVDGLDAAVEHIEKYGSHHTDAIITRNKDTAKKFVCRVDSSSVMVNTSTRFSDGAQYGLGAEIGISTDKLHARGPMGLVELTTYKWVVTGEGQLRE
ncbi:MAG: glutamate-5-semialdehyde dehydrogenase [Candidatus Glassbacteria bacterium]|nr:glutamate-5-semialdehyde dehydrogenase [Candidatus Glassbacteria bacterium]